MSLILKSILNQPSYLESWNLSDFAYFDCEGRNLLIKELINYAIKHKNQNKIPLKEIIMNDRSLSSEQIKSYLNILDDLQYIDGFLNKNEFDNKIKKLMYFLIYFFIILFSLFLTKKHTKISYFSPINISLFTDI